MSNPELNRSIEAILMVVEEPVSEVVLAQIIEAPTEQVLEALHALSAEYESQGRGFALKQIAGGWRFYSHPDLAPLVEKFVLDGQQAKLTQAALETLAVIAYRQPISRARVSAIRGVNVELLSRVAWWKNAESNMRRAQFSIGQRITSWNVLVSTA
jgi:segregation and condensation protein B